MNLFELSKYKKNDFGKKVWKISSKQKIFNNDINAIGLDKLLDKTLENPNEFYKRICDELTTEERIFILKQLENKCCMNCANGSCRVEYNEKVGTDEFGKLQGSECAGWFNSELIGRSKVLRKTDINQLK